MSDPFSVAGSAVGVISLGISVCQGLVTYCSQYKSFNDGISNMIRKVQGLNDILAALHD